MYIVYNNWNGGLKLIKCNHEFTQNITLHRLYISYIILPPIKEISCEKSISIIKYNLYSLLLRVSEIVTIQKITKQGVKYNKIKPQVRNKLNQ